MSETREVVTLEELTELVLAALATADAECETASAWFGEPQWYCVESAALEALSVAVGYTGAGAA